MMQSEEIESIYTGEWLPNTTNIASIFHAEENETNSDRISIWMWKLRRDRIKREIKWMRDKAFNQTCEKVVSESPTSISKWQSSDACWTKLLTSLRGSRRTVLSSRRRITFFCEYLIWRSELSPEESTCQQEVSNLLRWMLIDINFCYDWQREKTTMPELALSEGVWWGTFK